jgi:hypothetical protein
VSLEKPNPSRTQYVAKRFEWRGEVSFKEKVDSPEILKKILEEFINKEPEDFVKREEARLRRYGKIEEPLTLEDLIMAFLQLDAQTLGERTYLNEEELKTLQETIVAFLQASTPSEKNYTLNRQTIPLLVFEYVAKFSIREKNVKMIERLSSDEMLFEQLVMGGGKTKVLLPLLALFKADGNRLVVIVVPEPLLETNLEDLSSSSFHTFKQKAIHFHWNLETPRDQVYLEKRVEELEDLIKKRGYLITTPTDIHHLILTYTALLDEKRVGSAVQIEKLFTLFQEKGNAIIDEFHTVAAPRKEVRYATGEKKYLNPLDIASVRKMYEMMSEKKLVPFDPKTKTLKHHLISEEEFETVKREILKISNEPLFQKEVNTLLKSTLYNKKYGPSQEKEELLYCIPYSDEKTPKEGSEFENPFATLNYSFQYYMSKGIGEKAATVFLEDLKKTIREEMGKSGCSFLETKTGAQMLSEIEGFSFDMSVERFKEGVNQSIRALLFFVETQVAPKIGFFEEVSLSNAPRLFSFFSKIQALSATPYNFKTYPQDMKLQLDDHDLKLIENKVVKEKGDSLVITLRDKGIDAIFEKIPLKENQVRAFIDVGAFFENKKNREIALELLQYFKKECPEIGGVRYFEGDILRVEGDEGSQDLFTYYDRTHTTGVDIPQKEGAKAIVFIGQLTLKSDLIQAIGRMRGLLNKRQEIIPLMDEDEAVKVPSVSTVPTFNEVLTHSKSLEDKEGLEDITQSQIQYRENEEITKEVKKLHSLKSSEKIEAFKKIRETSFFVRKVKSFLSEEEGVSRVNMEVVTEQITEQKQSITQQVSLKMESAYAKASPIKEFGEVRAFSWESIKSFEDLNFKRVQEVLKEERGIEKSIFSDTLYFSPLIESPFLEVKASPFTQYGETPYHVLGLRDKNNKIHFVILSLNETAQLIQKPLKGSILFSGLTGNIVGTPQDRFKEEEKELVLEILSQTRFLSGHLHHALKPKDLASFKKWFESDGREERVKLLPFVLNQEGLKTYMSYLIDLKI